MTNPFEALGAGGFDMNALLQQAQQLQEQLASTQAELAEQQVEGSVAGGAVTVTLSGTGELEALSIRPGVVDGEDPESLADLADLVVAAYRDARAAVERLASASMGSVTDGLLGDLPQGGQQAGFGLPPAQD